MQRLEVCGLLRQCFRLATQCPDPAQQTIMKETIRYRWNREKNLQGKIAIAHFNSAVEEKETMVC